LELLPVLVLDMIEILPLLGKIKYDTWRILLRLGVVAGRWQFHLFHASPLRVHSRR
jgi:hypothetical protein